MRVDCAILLRKFIFVFLVSFYKWHPEQENGNITENQGEPVENGIRIINTTDILNEIKNSFNFFLKINTPPII